MSTLNDGFERAEVGLAVHQASSGKHVKILVSVAVAIAVLMAVGVLVRRPLGMTTVRADAAPPAPLPTVAVSAPFQRDLETRLGFLGQFSAVKRVEFRTRSAERSWKSASRTATSSKRVTSCSQSTRSRTKSS